MIDFRGWRRLFDEEKRAFSIGDWKKIALVANDSRNGDPLEWAAFNRDLLAQHELYATGTTGRLLKQELELAAVTPQRAARG